MSDGSFREDLVAAIPMLRGFARSLSGNRDRADDLVQETLAKAISNRDKYRQGTNLHAWLVTILRNQYYSEGRRRWREISDAEGTHAAKLTATPGHDSQLEMREFLAAMQVLPPDQREALILVGAGGMAYEEAAHVCQVAVGTIKSRVSRARKALEVILAETHSRKPAEHEIGADKAFDDILDQASALAEGGVRARGED